jgi:hypothetical protein
MIKIEAVTTAITWNHNPIIDKYVINFQTQGYFQIFGGVGAKRGPKEQFSKINYT